MVIIKFVKVYPVALVYPLYLLPNLVDNDREILQGVCSLLAEKPAKMCLARFVTYK